MVKSALILAAFAATAFAAVPQRRQATATTVSLTPSESAVISAEQCETDRQQCLAQGTPTSTCVDEYYGCLQYYGIPATTTIGVTPVTTSLSPSASSVDMRCVDERQQCINNGINDQQCQEYYYSCEENYSITKRHMRVGPPSPAK